MADEAAAKGARCVWKCCTYQRVVTKGVTKPRYAEVGCSRRKRSLVFGFPQIVFQFESKITDDLDSEISVFVVVYPRASNSN